MKSNEIIIYNFEEIRRRSIKVWQEIPQNLLDWKPDEQALSMKEMIRHVLDSEHYYHLCIKNRGSLSSYQSPFENRSFISVQDELQFSQPYRKGFLNTIKAFTEEELSDIQIDRSDVGYVRSLGDMLLRVGYHEAVHTGQMLDYLRTADVKRANIWD
jgi:uncharacterized damage-inducible protein DinB